MNISSRTPEGSPGRCSLCGKEVRMEPSWPTLDALCPYCGNLVWLRPPKRSRVPREMASVPLLPATLVASLIALGLICANWWLLESWQERAFVNIVVLFLVVMLLFGRWIGNIGLPQAAYLLGRCVFESMSGIEIWAGVHFGSILLMLPSALLLGIGIQHLRLSFVGLYSLIVGRPVYGFNVMVDTRRKA